MSSVTPTDLTLRPARAEDRAALGELFWTTRAAAVPAMPPLVRSRDDIVNFYRELDLEDGREVWVAEGADELLGFVELKRDWVDDLYVHPDHQGAGVGTALLELVKALRPAGFGLWVFESNLPARAFYAARGLVELDLTDGSDNEEHAPDIRMEWRGI